MNWRECSDGHIAFIVKGPNGDIFEKRYSDFRSLHNTLKGLLPKNSIPPLPATSSINHLIHGNSPDRMDERR